MKIIIRDTFTQYFPKFFQSYQALPQQDKQTIFTGRKNTPKIQTKDQQDSFLPQIITKKSSLSKDKLPLSLNLKKSTPKQQQTRSKSTQPKYSYQLSQQEEQKLSELINQRLKSQIINFITFHRFKTKTISPQNCFIILAKFLLLLNIQDFNSHNKSKSFPKLSQNHSQQLYKLSLYLNKETNKQIFSVYQHILIAGPRSGISYQALAKKLKTDIINVSHFCCKLKKMRFVDWEHKKDGVIVYPKAEDSSRDSNELSIIDLKNQEKTFDYSKSFIFTQLTLNQNILINMASSSSIFQGGLTNEEIKFRIMKHAENKMVRRTVQGMKHIQKNAQRQGKVFEFKYKKETPQIIKEMDRKRVETSGIVDLTQNLRRHLNIHYASMCKEPLSDEQLLQHIVNTRLTDYVSSIGIKQSKRQCTPLKLNRYIHILNYLEINGPETELDLRRHIIEVQKDLVTYQGIIHKRSTVGILEGLKKIQLVEEIDGYIYPKWIQVKRKQKSPNKIQGLSDEDIQLFGNGKKRIKRESRVSKSNEKLEKQAEMSKIKGKVRIITKKQHRTEIFTELLNFTFEKALQRVLRRGFYRILHHKNKKQCAALFVSEGNLLHLLDDDFKPQKPVTEHATTLESFLSQVNSFVSAEGKTLIGFPQVEHEVVKYVRRNPNKNADNLRSKYGKGWRQKFDQLQKQGVIKISQEGYETLQSFDGFLV